MLRTAFQLQSAKISSRKILDALSRLKAELPDELPLSGIRVTSVGNTIAVKTGPSQWDANTGQLLLDFSSDRDTWRHHCRHPASLSRPRAADIFQRRLDYPGSLTPARTL